jgi:hypothetical protein
MLAFMGTPMSVMAARCARDRAATSRRNANAPVRHANDPAFPTLASSPLAVVRPDVVATRLKTHAGRRRRKRSWLESYLGIRP